MKKINQLLTSLFILFVFALQILGTSACIKDEVEKTASDAQAVEALRDVDFSHDSTTINFIFPEGAFSGQSLDTLMDEAPEIYSDLANYTINFGIFMLADNTKEDARDAKFDGMKISLVFDTVVSNPVETHCDGFEVKKGETAQVECAGSINLETHRYSGIYIFEQTVAGEDVTTTMRPTLFYKIGSLEGEINLPEITVDIPTRASDETKAFLQELLDSDLLDEEQ